MLRRILKQGGSALLPVLILALISGVLISTLFVYIEKNNKLAITSLQRIQADMMVHSALSYGLAKINSADTLLGGLHYATEQLDYRVEDKRLGFRLRVKPRGLFSEITGEGRLQLGEREIVSRAAARAGQMIDLREYPAVALTNRQGNLVLAGKAEIVGPVLLWRGGVRKATSRKVRFRGKTGHQGPVWDSTSAVWKKIPLDVGNADKWISEQEDLLKGAGSAENGKSGFKVLSGGLWQDTVFAYRGDVVIGRDAVLRRCEISAGTVLIQENARLEDCLVYASRRLRVADDAALGGQFIARDSMEVSVARPLEDWPVFYVHGRKTVRFVRDTIPDTVYIGLLDIQRASGRGVFLFGGHERRPQDGGLSLRVGKAVSLAGLIYAEGIVEMNGRLEGSLICNNLKFSHQGTIFLGHLMDASIRFARKSEAFSGQYSVPVPLMFPLGNKAVVVSKQWGGMAGPHPASPPRPGSPLRSALAGPGGEVSF